MLLREDIYGICEETLKTYYQTKKTVQTKLYIYPHLNAIITKHPSRNVKKFLYTEYRVNASIIKKIAVWLYTRLLMNTSGLFASRTMVLDSDANCDTLIYPCNRKIRIFDFKKGIVTVEVKCGFPTESLRNEITFRLENAADFIPAIECWSGRGYTERIIDGYPLARAGRNTRSLSEKAFEMWDAYIEPSARYVESSEYVNDLNSQINSLFEKENVVRKHVDIETSKEVISLLFTKLYRCEKKIKIVKSHGDLQPGNIWVQNDNEEIVIIDWETFAERSALYDRAMLFDNLRSENGVPNYLERYQDTASFFVVLEEIVLRLNELNGLPGTDGAEAYNLFISKICSYLRSKHV